jgi:hypothetical protein
MEDMVDQVQTVLLSLYLQLVEVMVRILHSTLKIHTPYFLHQNIMR